jgi:UrcA family protein
LIGASFFITGPAHGSQPGVVEASLSVSLADLNLSNDAGVEALYRRLQRAARQVCGPQNLRDSGSLQALKSNRQCANTSLDRAVAEIGEEALARLHNA